VAETEKSAKKIVRATEAVWLPEVPLTVKFKGLAVVAERALTVSVLLCPATIEAGLNAQVAPDPQARLMLPVNVLGAEAAMLNAVELEVVPMSSTVDRVLADRAKTAMPIPESVSPGLFIASDVIDTLPVRLPVAVGVNVTVMVQV
jgi:hypothetical protein